MNEFARTMNHRAGWVIRLPLEVGIWVLYVVACFAPVFQTKAEPHDGGRGEWGVGMQSTAVAGWLALLLGWAWRKSIWVLAPWSANLFLFVSLGFLRRRFPRIALGLGVIGSLAALSVFWLPGDPDSGIQEILWGCYFWLASLLIVTLWALATCIANGFGGKPQAKKDAAEVNAIVD
jgi:hypothetical protein